MCLYVSIIPLNYAYVDTFPKYLNNNEGIEKKMNDLFSQSPKIELTVECYHTLYSGDSEIDKVTYKENVKFDYYSWKDISGIFILGNIEAQNYPFIKLYLEQEIYFSDSISIYDLNQMKDNLIEKNKEKDKKISLIDNRTIPGFDKYNLICIDPKNAHCLYFNKILFNILIFIPPLCVLYIFYLESKCHYQRFIIRKVISTRKDLNNDEKYNLMIPGLKYNGELIKYENTGNINNNYDLKEPTKEELDKSMEYNNLVPNF